ncbi:MAG: hypothetical protein A2Y28_01200 [Chlamydiae bacterium GWC2_50_10]|nr:MAG: hypothetical protein A2Z85_01245 [Chlamydiae bacterium GWA2_50_15]OGN53812.1 MAG: hypothetical protein A2Y28_01200 [Chlamydiae bacterium GWC2_50_10]OGN54461.1 MAG: hypothetical protein A2098_01830 [Chlamydiae bacterium GWF2_49_8]OGN58359.1 MAG: hypothetical protein A3D18_00380 [Chlamydiae bacterium RIFCSPHIGHO2_02_FULL_49_29]OGN64139.1 MAG: hypothetical protein A3E26_02975 [Chlamydiae bacterium RIFCSPHIGHO2_12_FULL_49_32]OGN68221.1 MAG: hypothetical protein A3I15_05075 [Chlamydiae bact
MQLFEPACLVYLLSDVRPMVELGDSLTLPSKLIATWEPPPRNPAVKNRTKSSYRPCSAAKERVSF